jgi:choline/glycine/proline betaine transport protein
VLLLAGGLNALQTVSIAGALPFVVIMLVMCYGLMKGLRLEGIKQQAFNASPTPASGASKMPWQQRLKILITYPKKTEMQRFLDAHVGPALEAVAEEIRKNQLDVEVTRAEDNVVLTVMHGEEEDFTYGVYAVPHLMPSFAFPEFETKIDERQRYYRAEVYLSEGSQHYDIYGYTRDQVIADVLAQYEKHMHFLHLAR